MKRQGWGLLIAVAALAGGVPGSAGGALVAFTVYDTPGVEFDVTFAYSPVDASNATISVWLDNLSVHEEARITGFGFNVPDGTLDEVDPPQGAPFLVYTPDVPGDGSGFMGIVDYSNGGNAGIGADGYGRFDMAAYNGPGGLNNGTPARGIADSGTFVFTVTGSGLDALDEMSFLSLCSEPPGAGKGVQPFVVRWQDMDSGSGFAVIPEPAAVSLLALGCAALLRRRRR